MEEAEEDTAEEDMASRADLDDPNDLEAVDMINRADQAVVTISLAEPGGQKALADQAVAMTSLAKPGSQKAAVMTSRAKSGNQKERVARAVVTAKAVGALKNLPDSEVPIIQANLVIFEKEKMRTEGDPSLERSHSNQTECWT